MKKKLLSFILMMSLLISSLAGLPMEVLAGTDVSYVDEEGNTQTLSGTGYTEITNATATLTDGWYVVQENVTLYGSLTVNGDVHLILTDGKTFSVTVAGSSNYKAGIAVTPGHSLTIYGQEGGTGKLVAKGGPAAAGIGGGDNQNGGNITIAGGDVEATGGEHGAGIGGGYQANGGNIKIIRGKVEARGGNYGAGIGGGNNSASMISGGTVTISGGEVEAIGGYYGAGIGGGWAGRGGSIDITGGRVIATGGAKGAGIGGGLGNNGKGGDVTITGGIVFAQGDTSTKDIGGGSGSSDHGSLNISGSTALFLRNDKSDEPTTNNHYHRTFSNSAAVTGYAVPGTWDSEFGAWLPLTLVTITFDSTGGSPVADIIQDPDTELISPADPSREGYTFTGWEPSLPATMPNTDMEVVALWEADPVAAETYTVSFDSKGGSSVESITDIEEGTTITLPENPRKDGYIFKGWFIENPTAVDADTPFTETTLIIEDITVYAKWEAEEVGQLTPIDPEKPIEKEDKEEESPAKTEDEKAKAQLPKTGASSSLLFYGLGGLSMLLGIKSRRKNNTEK